MEAWIYIGSLIIVMNTAYWMFIVHGVQKVSHSIEDTKNEDDISIVVVNRNGIVALQSHLDVWIEQNADHLTVLVVDDDSTDASLEWLNKKEKEHNMLHVIHHKKVSPGKKDGLARGLQSCNTKWVLLTDVDCRPHDNSWARMAISAAMEQDVYILLMYAPFYPKKGWLDRLIRFENVVTAWQYFSWWSVGKPYMAVGRNVLYEKSIYRGFSRAEGDDLASGDDDLFIQKKARVGNTGATLDPATFVYSDGPDSWIEWLSQKSRHISTSYSYSFFLKAVLGFFAFSQIVSLLMTLSCFFYFQWFIFVLLLIRWTLLRYFGKKALEMLQQEDLSPYLILLELFFSIYLVVLWSFSLLRSNKKW